MGGGGGWDYDYSDSALRKSSKAYTAEAKAEGIEREYEGTEAQGIPLPVGVRVSTNSPTPLVVGVDVTGSMGKWPRIIFEKLPVLYNEIKLFLPDVEVSFVAIGDMTTDRFPLQVCDFRQGKELEEGINAIYPEGGGGGGCRESYELAAYFYARCCDMPKAERPIFVFCGDEGFYETIKSNAIKRLTGEEATEDVPSVVAFDELKDHFEVFILRLTYGSAESEREIQKQWEGILGKKRVLKLEDPRRIVDAIIGLAAIVGDEAEEFSRRIAIRQTPEQVEQVMATLHPLIAGGGGKKKKKS